MYKISKPPKKQVIHRKKDNRALKFKQTMATNLRLGNTRHAVEKNHLRPPSWNSFVRPQVPASRDKKAARVWRSTPAHVRLALALRSPEKREKITPAFQAADQGF